MGIDFGKKFKGFFVEVVEDEEVDEATEQPQEETPAPASTTPAAPVTGVEDQKINDSLMQAIVEANQDGFDYFEFAQLLTQLKPTIPSEQMLFQTAFTSGKVMGASKQKLIETAAHYLKVLLQKKEEFETAVQGQTDQTVTSLGLELQNVDEAVETKNAMIQKLTDEINELAASKTDISNSIAENKAKIEKVQANFVATYNKISSRIQGDVEKINKYVPEGETANA